MNKEKIILSLIALALGLVVAGVSFYFYESSKTLTETKTHTATITPSPTQAPIYLTIDSPRDEEVVSTKILTISGKTTPSATIIITNDTTDQVVTPASTGNFSITTTLTSQQNMIRVTAVSPTGAETTATLTVTYSTENF